MALFLSTNSTVSSSRGSISANPIHIFNVRQHAATPIRSLVRLPNADVARRCGATRAAPLKTIENLSTDYCNDFVCTSSPAVAEGVRSFARGLELMRLPPGLFASSVQYSDGVRSFKGPQGYTRLKWINENVQGPKVVSILHDYMAHPRHHAIAAEGRPPSCLCCMTPAQAVQRLQMLDRPSSSPASAGDFARVDWRLTGTCGWVGCGWLFTPPTPQQ